MPVSVRKNAPEPVTPPPTTYDIIGLNRDEAALIRDLIGRVALGSVVDTAHLYNALFDAIPGQTQDFDMVAQSGSDSIPIGVIHVNFLG